MVMKRGAQRGWRLWATLASRNKNVCAVEAGTQPYSSAAANVKTLLEEELEKIRSGGTWKAERVICSPQDVNIDVSGSSRKILNFCANNYLGLSSHPEVISAGKSALDSRGAGLSSVRFICGTQDIHKDLEAKISQFHDMDDAILYASCFDANAGLFEVLLTADDAVLSDELNHASIIDGIRLCKAKKYRYQHTNMTDLEEKLKEAQTQRIRLIATDGVFSMDGSVAPLREICDLADKYNAMVFIDDCHGTGFFGRTGRGTDEHCSVRGRVDIINSTLGKAMGGAAGGYTAACRPLVDLLRQRSRPYLFSNTLPPPVVAQAAKVFDILMDSEELVQRVSDNTRQFREGMTAAGFSLAGDKSHPICPVMLGDARLASQFADLMLERGVYVIGFSYPVVPKGKARIRVQISASHTPQQIDETVAAFTEVGKLLNIV